MFDVSNGTVRSECLQNECGDRMEGRLEKGELCGTKVNISIQIVT